MVAVTAGRISFSDIENDFKILFSEWPYFTENYQFNSSLTLVHSVVVIVSS